MTPLINETDNRVLESVDNLQNAVFYKDMLAFYDAYTSFYNLGIENLPNYCVINNRIYLNGICLLIKDYSSEFDFETLDLSLEYLKVLYYSIAKFSSNAYFPKKETIISEFEKRKASVNEHLGKATNNLDKSKIIFDDARNRFEQQEKLFNVKLLKYKNVTLNTILFALIGLVAGAVCILLGITKVIDMVIAIILAVVMVALSVLFVVLGIKRKKKLKQAIEDGKESFEKLKTNQDGAKSDYKKDVTRRDLLKLEIYNYLSLNNKIQKMGNIDNELLLKAIEYNMLSYNLKFDILEAFEEHNKDIFETIENINKLKLKTNVNDDLSEIYNDIMRKDWLYHNDYVRNNFILKLISSAEKTHIWQVKVGETYVDPFEIRVKDIAEEKVAFLQDNNSLFVGMPINRLVKTNIFKEHRDLVIPKEAKVMDIKNIRTNYANKFYNYDEVSKLKNVFYLNNSDIKHSKMVDPEMIEDKKMIPTIVDMKLRVMESELKSENSHHKIIKDVVENIINEYEEVFEDIYDRQVNFIDEELMESLENLENLDDYEQIPFDAMYDDGIEEIKQINEYKIEYTVNGQKITGYKL